MLVLNKSNGGGPAGDPPIYSDPSSASNHFMRIVKDAFKAIEALFRIITKKIDHLLTGNVVHANAPVKSNPGAWKALISDGSINVSSMVSSVFNYTKSSLSPVGDFMKEHKVGILALVGISATAMATAYFVSAYSQNVPVLPISSGLGNLLDAGKSLKEVTQQGAPLVSQVLTSANAIYNSLSSIGSVPKSIPVIVPSVSPNQLLQIVPVNNEQINLACQFINVSAESLVAAVPALIEIAINAPSNLMQTASTAVYKTAVNSSSLPSDLPLTSSFTSAAIDSIAPVVASAAEAVIDLQNNSLISASLVTSNLNPQSTLPLLPLAVAGGLLIIAGQFWKKRAVFQKKSTPEATPSLMPEQPKVVAETKPEIPFKNTVSTVRPLPPTPGVQEVIDGANKPVADQPEVLPHPSSPKLITTVIPIDKISMYIDGLDSDLADKYIAHRDLVEDANIAIANSKSLEVDHFDLEMQFALIEHDVVKAFNERQYNAAQSPTEVKVEGTFRQQFPEVPTIFVLPLPPEQNPADASILPPFAEQKPADPSSIFVLPPPGKSNPSIDPLDIADQSKNIELPPPPIQHSLNIADAEPSDSLILPPAPDLDSTGQLGSVTLPPHPLSWNIADPSGNNNADLSGSFALPPPPGQPVESKPLDQRNFTVLLPLNSKEEPLETEPAPTLDASPGTGSTIKKEGFQPPPPPPPFTAKTKPAGTGEEKPLETEPEPTGNSNNQPGGAHSERIISFREELLNKKLRKMVPKVKETEPKTMEELLARNMAGFRVPLNNVEESQSDEGNGFDDEPDQVIVQTFSAATSEAPKETKPAPASTEVPSTTDLGANASTSKQRKLADAWLKNVAKEPEPVTTKIKKEAVLPEKVVTTEGGLTTISVVQGDPRATAKALRLALKGGGKKEDDDFWDQPFD